MKYQFITLAFSVLFVHQLGRFILSLDGLFDESGGLPQQVQSPVENLEKYETRDFALSRFGELSSKDEREARKAGLKAACALSSTPKLLKHLSAKQKSVLLKHIIVSEKYKFLYCYIPKVACSNWKRVVMVLNGVSDDFVKDHPYGLTYLSEYSTSEIEEKLKTYYKFAIVRNPLERLLSAYRNKFGEIEDAMRTYGVGIKKKYGTYKEEEYYGKVPGDDVSFEEFIRYLVDQDSPENMNEHWAPMNTLCQPCAIGYDFIGSYDNLYEDSEAILREVEAPPMLHFPARQLFYSPATYATTAYYYSLVNTTFLEKLYTKYSQDFTLFSYPFPKSKQNSSMLGVA